MGVLIWLIIFLASLAVLIKASDYFTESAEEIGLHFGMPAFVVGITIVAIGTSLPELISSLFAVFHGATEIIVANVIGSNIANVFLVFGVTMIFAKKIKLSHENIKSSLGFFIASAFFLVITCIDGIFSFYEALTFILLLVIYLIYTLMVNDVKVSNVKGGIKKVNPMVYFTLLLSCVFIYFGAKYTVISIVSLSDLFGIGVELIAVTAVALGTSLPELSVSFAAIKRKNAEMAIGNILGSSIFNTFAVMGIPGLFAILIIPQNMIFIGLPVMVVATLSYAYLVSRRVIVRAEGVVLVALYLLFLALLFFL